MAPDSMMLAHLADHRHVAHVVPHVQLGAGAEGRFQHLVHGVQGDIQRLLAERRDAGFQGALGDHCVLVVRGQHQHGVQARVEQLVQVGGDGCLGQLFGCVGATAFAGVTHHGHDRTLAGTVGVLVQSGTQAETYNTYFEIHEITPYLQNLEFGIGAPGIPGTPGASWLGCRWRSGSGPRACRRPGSVRVPWWRRWPGPSGSGCGSGSRPAGRSARAGPPAG